MQAHLLSLAAMLATSMLAQPMLAASENIPPSLPPADTPRDLPPGVSEAEIRLYCTRKYDEEVALIPDIAGGAGGMLTGPAMEEWRRCMRRNGVEP